MSVTSGTLGVVNQYGPRPAALTAGTPGASPDADKERRTVDHSAPPNEGVTTPPLRHTACPTCDAAAISEGLLHDRGIVTGHYTCSAGHIWITRWLAVAT